jgi:transposase-like protein
MERRRHGREFKLEAVRLVRERGVSVAQAALARLLARAEHGVRLNEHIEAEGRSQQVAV